MRSQNYFQQIWRHRWAVLIVALFTAGVVGAARENAPQTYQATSLLTVTPAAELAGGQVNPEATAFDARAYAARATSSVVLSDAVRAAHLAPTPGQLRTRVHTRTAPQSGDIAIVTTASNATDAAGINRAVTNALIARVAADQAVERQAVVSPLDVQIMAAAQSLTAAEPGSPAATEARSTYNALLEARATRQARPDDRIDVIDQASAPSSPISPKPMRDAAFGFVVALVVAAEVAIFVDRLPIRRRGQDRDIARLRVPVLARLGRGTASEGLALAVDIVDDALAKPSRARLAVVAAGDGVGRSFVCRQLASAYRARGRSVVLVDGDLRSPSLHAELLSRRAPGFTDLLLDADADDDAVATALVPVEQGLRLLPAGGPAPDPSRVLAAQSVHRVLDLIAADIVIVDAPTSPTDAVAVARACDGFLFVTGPGELGRHARRVVAMLEAVGSVPVGVIVNHGAAAAAREPGVVGSAVQVNA